MTRTETWANAFFFIGTPVLVTVVTFAVYTQVFHNDLTAETAFTALALFNLLMMPMDALPDMVVQILSSLVSVRRIDNFLKEPETLKYEQLHRDDSDRSDDDPIVGFQDATFVFKVNEDEDGALFRSRASAQKNFPGFVDIGCGNSLLVHILNQEGYAGWGFDARQRKSWAQYTAPSAASPSGHSLTQRLLLPNIILEGASSHITSSRP